MSAFGVLQNTKKYIKNTINFEVFKPDDIFR